MAIEEVVITMIQVVGILFLVPAMLISAYNCFLLVTAFPRPRKSNTSNQPTDCQFIILIPAHNEEGNISKTLLSCARLDYPESHYKVCVVADNCSDRTAEIVRQHGVLCLERYDDIKRGKGYALEWAIDQLKDNIDAFVILDADCMLEQNALKVFAASFAKGAGAVQSRYVVANPDESPLSYAQAVGNTIENDLFYASKSRLGLAILLRGTGMAIKKAVLSEHPWGAHSIVEDVEYSIGLIRHGVRVDFSSETQVLSDFPATVGQLTVQRKRWATGNLNLGKTQALGLMRDGLVKKNLQLFDAGWTLLVLSRPLLILFLAIAAVASITSFCFAPTQFSLILLLGSLGFIALNIVYFSVGIAVLGLSFKRLGLLLRTPFTVARLIGITLAGLMDINNNAWARTPRN
ncbi:MAG: glycosyltransferase family 2 protein [Nitrospirota bacterium]|nr:glycosyltransferase family 2 protein [Nitrospirota bacterium]